MSSVAVGVVGTPRMPTRYEDLDVAFRGRLRPNPALLALVQEAYQGMRVSGGIRFLPIYGLSGCGKTSAALELATHLPEAIVVKLPREAVESREKLNEFLANVYRTPRPQKLLIAVVDQYEEVAAQRSAVPSSFVESLAVLDRGDLRGNPMLFVWLTTDRGFQYQLAEATTRNRRILVSADFELHGPARQEWPSIVEETFRFHNQDRDLSDFEIIEEQIKQISEVVDTIGLAIEEVGRQLFAYARELHDLSTYQVVMLWPVTDGLRISRIQQFTDARQGYKLDWNAWSRQMNATDRAQLPLKEYNRARLYFDMRLVPIAAADLAPLCRDLDRDDVALHDTYLSRFANTHFHTIAAGVWNPDIYAPMRARESTRADEASIWYETVTGQPVAIGRRLVKVFRELGMTAEPEYAATSPHGKVKADVMLDRGAGVAKIMVELKAFATENTMPSTICAQVLGTLRKYAVFAGFVPRQQ